MSFADNEVKRENIFFLFLRGEGGVSALCACLQPLASTSLPLRGPALCAGFSCDGRAGPISGTRLFVAGNERRLNPQRRRRETERQRWGRWLHRHSAQEGRKDGCVVFDASRPQGLIVRQSVNNKLAASPRHPGAPCKGRK